MFVIFALPIIPEVVPNLFIFIETPCMYFCVFVHFLLLYIYKYTTADTADLNKICYNVCMIFAVWEIIHRLKFDKQR